MSGSSDDKPGADESRSEADERVDTTAAIVVGEPGRAGPDSDGAGKRDPEPRLPERMAGVCLADGKVFDFDPGNQNLAVGDTVVVANERDLNLGRVAYVVPNKCCKRMRRVLRRVGQHDLLLMRRNEKREEEAFEHCSKRIAERNLSMKLVRVAFLHGGNKAIFFFTADGRVDFRALVRDLAQQMHVRIEMRQIGVRDEAKLLGGIGVCGQPLCCSRYLRKFVPVSIKMAKNQGLALNPQKVSGLCGRLMCCLVYEDDVYREMRKGFPKMGKTIDTPAGPAKVVETAVLSGRVRVLTESGLDAFTIEELKAGVKAPPREDVPGPAVRKKDEKDEKDEKEAAAEGRRSGRPRRRRKSSAAGRASDRHGEGAGAAKAKGPAKPEKSEQSAGLEQPAKSSEATPSQRKKRSRRRSRRRRNRNRDQSGGAEAKNSGSGPKADGKPTTE